MEVDLADTRLAEHIELALYRIAQECLQNVVKHANATSARLTPLGRQRRTARLEIVDDGVGFDTFEHPLGSDEMGGYGLLSMAERAELVGGRLNIRSRPGSGTAVTATIPLPSPARETQNALNGVSGAFPSARCSREAVTLRSRRRGGAASRSTWRACVTRRRTFRCRRKPRCSKSRSRPRPSSGQAR